MQLRAGCLLIFACIPALAQSHFFGYLAPGGEWVHSGGHSNGDAFVHIGGGGEFVLPNGVGVGADAGVLTFLFGGTLGTFSLTGDYHFRNGHRFDPFASGGYSVFFHDGHLSLGHVGGGANLWFGNHFGAKLQFRDHIHTYSGATANYPEVLLGLTFR